ncbi:glycosyltransferase family 4 protein [Candidatus Synechococcus spongiarum]|uniref:Undecaprenyl-phosphate N-acetylglucosaminyl 1-phosphate transferase n=1 Tax=Candidatus Synechococcus spongiarum TaxID=431041 RepID=A0A164Z763_9SYNE|nr:MraY family glycosyltransferase [Candidatus Synechococcus spongiarum]SAY40056.1 Undecaprenyl-phosphate N-acetylglucosaminyl 1-phosphate transferase (EC 2.7.8.-) [Candidatus Synechococcus spongiarum]
MVSPSAANPWSFSLLVFGLSMLITTLLAPVVRVVGLQFGLTDRPDTRKQHKTPIVRIGGIAMVLGFTLALAVTWACGAFGVLPRNQEMLIWAAIWGSLAFFCIGLADDLLSLPPLPRLSTQFLVATVVWEAGIRITAVNLHLGGQVLQFSTGFSLLVTVLWLVGITNAINWIDGLDGLAAGVGGIAAVGLTVVTFCVNDQVALAPTLLAAALAGTCLGFLRHNLNPAQIFMGDGGSYFLGFALASISIIGPAKEFTGVSLLLPLMILFLPLADMSTVVMGRLRSGCSPFYPDRRHLHHRLLRAGFSHRHTVFLIYAVTQWLACLALVVANVGNRFLWLSLATALLIWLLLRSGRTQATPRSRGEDSRNRVAAHGATAQPAKTFVSQRNPAHGP